MTSIQHTSMHIKFNASKHTNMHISNVTKQSSWACSPYLWSSLVQEFWSFFILQCCSLFVHVQLLLLPMMHLHVFVPTSPPLSSIFIRGVLLIDTKDCIGVDGWYLNLAFFMETTKCWNDTTCSPCDTVDAGPTEYPAREREDLV